jgi:hypothetical protein
MADVVELSRVEVGKRTIQRARSVDNLIVVPPACKLEALI